MDFYEWSIAEDGSDGALLSQWTRIEDIVFTGEEVCFPLLRLVVRNRVNNGEGILLLEFI